AGHQKAARRQQAHGKTFVAAGAQIVREESRRSSRRLLVLLLVRSQRCKLGVPLRCEVRARLLPRERKAFSCPLLIAFIQKRQVEEPFSGIIDDIKRQYAFGAVLALVVDDEPQFAYVDGRARPAPLLDQTAQVVLVI